MAASSYPHNARKNRVLSFLANNDAPECSRGPRSFLVTLTEIGSPECFVHDPAGDVDMTWWVTAPVCTDLYGHDTGAVPGLDSCAEPNIWRSQLTLELQGPFEWPDECVHLIDCEVIPLARYEIRAVNPGTGDESAPLVVETIARPWPKYWADVCGALYYPDHQWSPPNGVTAMDDVMAAVFYFTNHPYKPHRTWVELADEGPDMVLNFTDIFQIVRGFSGYPYPYPNPSSCP